MCVSTFNWMWSTGVYVTDTFSGHIILYTANYDVNWKCVFKASWLQNSHLQLILPQTVFRFLKYVPSMTSSVLCWYSPLHLLICIFVCSMNWKNDSIDILHFNSDFTFMSLLVIYLLFLCSVTACALCKTMLKAEYYKIHAISIATCMQYPVLLMHFYCICLLVKEVTSVTAILEYHSAPVLVMMVCYNVSGQDAETQDSQSASWYGNLGTPKCKVGVHLVLLLPWMNVKG
jgi:hypothetical protein